MGRDLELCIAADRLDRLLERAVGERRQQAALLANQMVVVLIGVDPLIAGRIATDLDSVHDVELLELVEGPVDSCPAH